MLNDWEDVQAARKLADDKAPGVAGLDEPHYQVVQALEAHRLEIRALGITISHAVDEALRAGR